jgi:hypothetical protein
MLLIANFSIKEEQGRGESIEDIDRKIQEAKLRKQRQAMLMKGNKADNAKKAEEDEGEDHNEDRQRLQALHGHFN